MTITAERIARDALRLPVATRANLAARLIESLDEGTDDGVEAAWDVEIARRIEELDGGTVEPIPWETARQVIRGSLGGRRED